MESGGTHRRLPPDERLVPLCAHDDPVDFLAKPHLLHRHPLPASRRQSRFQRLEHRRVVVHRLRETLQEDGGAVARLPLRHRHHCWVRPPHRRQKRAQLAAVVVVVLEQLVKEEHAVDGEGFPRAEVKGEVEIGGDGGVRREKQGMELEPEVEGVGEGLEAAAGAPEDVEAGSGAGDANGRRGVLVVRALSDGLQKRRPLEAVGGIKVEDVDAGAAFDGLKNRLVRRQVREAQKRRDLVEGEVGRLDRLRRRRPAQPAVGPYRQRERELVREPVGSIPKRGRRPEEQPHGPLRCGEIPAADEVRAADQQLPRRRVVPPVVLLLFVGGRRRGRVE